MSQSRGNKGGTADAAGWASIGADSDLLRAQVPINNNGGKGMQRESITCLLLTSQC